MKHSQVKGKTLQFTVTTEYGEKYKAGLKKRTSNLLDAGYYDIKNDIELMDTGKSFTGSASKLVKFFFSEEDAGRFVEAFNVKSSLSVLTKDKKVNRFKLELVGFEMEVPYSLPSGGPLDGECEVCFRAGGDYTVKRAGKEGLSYGPNLKADQFTNDGFNMTDCAGAVIHYKVKA